jgi:hypothetical protein
VVHQGVLEKSEPTFHSVFLKKQKHCCDKKYLIGSDKYFSVFYMYTYKMDDNDIFIK